MLEHYRFTWVTRKISWTVINIQSSFKIHLFSLKAAYVASFSSDYVKKQVFWYVTSRVLVCILDSIMNSQLICRVSLKKGWSIFCLLNRILQKSPCTNYYKWWVLWSISQMAVQYKRFMSSGTRLNGSKTYSKSLTVIILELFFPGFVRFLR